MNNNFANRYVFTDNAELEKKRQVRQSGMFIGIAMLVTLAVQLFWSLLYFNVMKLFGINTADAILIAGQPIISQLINQILSVVCFTAPFLIITSGCQIKLSEAASYKKPEKALLLPIILICVSFFSFANIASSVFTNFLAGFGIVPTSPSTSAPEGVFGFAVTFIGAAVVAPLTEEFAMRGVVMGSLRKYGDGFAIIVSALLFGLMHGNFVQIPFAFIVGLALGFAVVKTGSVWTGVIVHFLNNAMAVLLDTLTTGLSDSVKLIVNTGYFSACLICLFVGILLLKGKTEELSALEEAPEELPSKKTAKHFFTSPFIIAYIVLIIFCALGNTN